MALTCVIVGVGQRVKDVLLPALAASAAPIRVTAVVDPAPGAAAAIAALSEAGVVPPSTPVYADLDGALAARRYDVGIVACPHAAHQAAATQLLQAGVTVWKEKPFALSSRDAAQLAELADRPGGPGLRVLAHRPHGQFFEHAARLLPRWGRILSYRISIARTTPPYAGTWRASPATAGGGALLDLGYHAFDLIARFTPRVEHVAAAFITSPAWRDRVEVDEAAHVLLTHAGGATGTVYVSRFDAWADDVEIVTEHGTIRIHGSRAELTVTEPGGLAHTVTLAATEQPWARMLGYHAATHGQIEVTRREVNVGIQAVDLMTSAYTAAHTAARGAARAACEQSAPAPARAGAGPARTLEGVA